MEQPQTRLREKLAAKRAAVGEAPASVEPPAVVRAVGINPPADGVASAIVTGPAGVTTTTATATATVSPPPATTEGFDLYIDCIPMKGVAGAVTHLEEEIATRSGPIAKAAGKADIRQVAYNDGVGRLAASFRQTPLRGVVVATANGVSAQLLEMLTPMATVVVRGMR